MDKLTNKKLTDELINVFDYIKNNILIEFPSNNSRTFLIISIE